MEIRKGNQTLIGFRPQYGEVLNKIAKSLKDLEAMQKRATDPSKATEIEAAGKKLEAEAEALEQQQTGLVDSVNKYCGGG